MYQQQQRVAMHLIIPPSTGELIIISTQESTVIIRQSRFYVSTLIDGHLLLSFICNKSRCCFVLLLSPGSLGSTQVETPKIER